jgi:hypothetical protein
MSSAEDERVRPAPAPTVALPARHDESRLAGVVEALPLMLAAFVGALTLVATFCLFLEAFHPALVLGVGLPAGAVAAAVVLGRRPSAARANLLPHLLAFVVVAITVGFNVGYSAQDITVARDPGTYALTGQWLAHHGTAHIATEPEVFGELTGVYGSSLGFGDAGQGQLQSQYPNAAPELVAMGGWISDAWLLRTASLIGGLALLAFFALARGFVRPWWALGATTLLAVSMPMLHFSRIVVSEPTTMIFLLGGIALLFEADRRGGVWLHLVAGLTGGAAGLARIDGGIFLMAVAGYAVMRLARAEVGRRARTGLELAALVLAALVPYLLGMRLTADLSPAYWYGHNGHAPEAFIPGLLALIIAVLGAGVVAVAWRGGSLRAGAERLAGRATSGFALLLLIVAAVGATRPLWLVSHQYIGPTFSLWIEYWQKAENLTSDGTRSYAEHTLAWLSWYDSAIVVVAGALGIAWLTRRVGRTGRPAALGFLVVWVAYSLISLTYPDITADQIWSMRRFLPIVIPGFLIGAAYVGSRLWRYGRGAQVAVAVLALAALGLTLRTDAPLVRTREGVPQLAEFENVCANLPANAAVLVSGGLPNDNAMTVRAYCRVPVANLNSSSGSTSNRVVLATGELAAIRSKVAAAGRTLVVLTDDPAGLPRNADGSAPSVSLLSQVDSSRWKPTLTHAPTENWPLRQNLYLVTVHEDGTVSTPPGQRTLVASG